MNNSRAWTLVIGILVILAVGMGLVVGTIKSLGERALAPVQGIQDASDAISTQVSGVLNPTPTILPDPVTIVHDIRSLARLETVQYTVERVITAESGVPLLGGLFGDKLLFVAHGIVVAGVDLQKIEGDDLWIENGILHFRMPAAEIFISTLDNEKSYVYDRETGLLTKGDINLEAEARRVAQSSIEDAALEDGILETAGKNAEQYFSILLRDLGYPEVIFEK